MKGYYSAGLSGIMLGLIACLGVWAQTPPVPAENTVSRGLALLGQGRYSEAAAVLGPWSAANPRDANLAYRLGVALERSGAGAAALQAYFRAHLAQPSDAVTVAALARLYARQGNYERGSFWYRRLLFLRQYDMRLALEAAEYSLKYKDPLAAEVILKRALTRQPAAADAWLLLAEVYRELKLSAEAARAYEKAAALRPLDRGALESLLQTFIRAGRHEEAIPYLQAALNQQPREANLRALLGDAYLASGSPAAAAAAYREACRLAPRQGRYWLALAEALATAGETKSALSAYEEAFRWQQPTAEQLLGAAALASRDSNSRLAQGWLSRLVALKPEALEFRKLLVDSALSNGEIATAAAQYRELRLAGAGEYVLAEAELARRLGARDWARARLGEAAEATVADLALRARVASLLLELGDRDRAVTLIEQALAAGQSNLEAMALAGQVLLGAGETERAEVVLRQVVERDPQLAAGQLGLARLLAGRGEVGAACQRLRQASSDHPRDYELAAELVDVADRAGLLPEVVDELRKRLMADPENETILEALANGYRLMGGTDRSARELHVLAQSRPEVKLWLLVAARELAAAGQWKEAAGAYEKLALESTYARAGRVGLTQTLSGRGLYMELLAALARLPAPGGGGAEVYQLLLQARAQFALAGGEAYKDLEAVADSAARAYLAAGGSEEYYLALADLYQAMGLEAQGVVALQEVAAVAERLPAAAAGLVRVLRGMGRTGEAMAWLDRAELAGATAAQQLERAETLMNLGRTTSAAEVVTATLTEGLAPPLKARAHLLSGDALRHNSRPEEALWHYSQALQQGLSARVAVERLTTLGLTQPLAERSIMAALSELWAAGYHRAALEVADTLSGKPGHENLTRWGLQRAGDLIVQQAQ